VTASTARTATESSSAERSPGAALGDVMTAALGVMSSKVDGWTDRLNAVAAGPEGAAETVSDLSDDLAEGGGAAQQAGIRGVEAGLVGKSPVWAAIKGAWTGGSTLTKVAVVAAGVVLVLVLVLSPVLLVVVLVAVPVAVVVTKARSRRH
jgi:hypothetical protein